jgi:succinate dehydrogenase / fumarate reductase cytochrome b subunit
MSTAAASLALSRAARFYQASVGKKAVMAVSGLLLYGFVILHLIGNLQVFLGPEKLNAYARALRGLGGLLWLARAGLAIAVLAHIAAAFQLWRANRAARPQPYRSLRAIESTYASRTMALSGPLLAAFIVYHLMHLTFGNAHPSFNHELDVYRNIVTGFSHPPAATAYIVAMLLLGLHLQHGVWSVFQSLGVSHPRLTPWLRRLASASAAFIVAGNISIPLAVLGGFLK